MKLIDIKPLVFENSTDETNDIFAEPEMPESGPELLAILQRKEKTAQWQAYRLTKDIDQMVNRAEGAASSWKYPGGYSQLFTDINSGKVINIHNVIVPKTPENMLIIQKVDKIDDQIKQLESTEKALHTQIGRLKKAESAKKLELKMQSISTKPSTIPESQIPDKIYYNGKKYFGNPYFIGEKDRYAGDPTFFKWSPQMLVMYQELEQILTSNGLAGFTIMYASTLIYSSGWSRGKPSNHYNFAVIGANGKFIWRKYDTSPGSGQNWVYVNGDKQNTSSFLSQQQRNPAAFSTLVAAMKQP